MKLAMRPRSSMRAGMSCEGLPGKPFPGGHSVSFEDDCAPPRVFRRPGYPGFCFPDYPFAVPGKSE